MKIEKRYFGSCPAGEVDIYKLTNDRGMSAEIATLGGTLVSLNVPDKNGNVADVVCGYETADDYYKGDCYIGALIGRVASRIGYGKFTLDGVDYTLAINNGCNSHHGGKIGFSRKIWTAKDSVTDEGCVLDLSYTSPDGEENYPGNLAVNVRYTLTEDNALKISYRATTDKKTLVNLTSHGYFNLGGFDSGEMYDHELWIDADTYIPVNEDMLPTGEIASVEGTPLDFRVKKSIRRDFNSTHRQMVLTNGYDHCLNFREVEDPMQSPRAIAIDPKSGREMLMYTDAPSVQLYTANFFDSDIPQKGGYPQRSRTAFCLETQKMPDSINHAGFTDVTLAPGEVYETTTIYKFV